MGNKNHSCASILNLQQEMFAVVKRLCTFAMQQVGELNHPVGQAVTLLIFVYGYFYARTLGYWRLPIRKLRLAFRGEVHQLVAAYMVTAFLLPMIYL